MSKRKRARIAKAQVRAKAARGRISGHRQARTNSKQARVLALLMTRGWQDYWHWKDKPVQERASARTVLEAAGVKIDELRSRNHDPPDCEAFLDGQWSGIEVTELLDQPTLEQSIRARRERDAGKIPERPEVWFVWQRDDLLAAIQRRIDEKDIAHKVKGGPYQRYVLVILTAETFLARECSDYGRYRVPCCRFPPSFRIGIPTQPF